MVHHDDSRLARRVQKGDRRAFEELLARYQRPIFSFIAHFFQDTALCEDLTQETFLRAYRFIASYRPQEKLATWLFAIAKNLCIDELRRLRKGTPADIDAVDPEALVASGAGGGNPLHGAIATQEATLITRAIRKLPEKYRTCIILFYYSEMSYDDISRVMDISMSNTKILLFRGKKMMLELYRKECGEGFRTE